MRFFLDNNLSPTYCALLRALDPDKKIHHLRERWPPSTHDDVWLPALAAEGDWVVLSGDVRISKSAKLREAWKAAAPKLTTFFLAPGWTNLGFWEQAWRIVRWWPLITEQSDRMEPGAVFLVPAGGAFKFQTFR